MRKLIFLTCSKTLNFYSVFEKRTLCVKNKFQFIEKRFFLIENSLQVYMKKTVNLNRSYAAINSYRLGMHTMVAYFSSLINICIYV